MQETNNEKFGIPPSFLTAEFFTPDGKRYNFEQMVLDTDSYIDLTNESGNTIRLRFWQTRQSERNFPVDPVSSERYVNDILPKIPTGVIKQ